MPDASLGRGQGNDHRRQFSGEWDELTLTTINEREQASSLKDMSDLRLANVLFIKRHKFANSVMWRPWLVINYVYESPFVCFRETVLQHMWGNQTSQSSQMQTNLGTSLLAIKSFERRFVLFFNQRLWWVFWNKPVFFRAAGLRHSKRRKGQWW